MATALPKERLIQDLARFLAEDIGSGDITTRAIFDRSVMASAVFLAREPLVIAGIEEIAPLVFKTVNPDVACRSAADGEMARPGEEILHLSGPLCDLLAGERVALNLCQRLCGIATLTRRFVDAVAGFQARIFDTRKTTPGLRWFEKYAVRVGGGANHRFGLFDAVLIKDNHLAVAGSVEAAVDRVREKLGPEAVVEVECETLEQVEACLAAQVEVIMLDNMDTALMRQAVELVAGRAVTEASGGITLANVREVAATGVDRISVGALTHSAAAVDISMEISRT